MGFLNRSRGVKPSGKPGGVLHPEAENGFNGGVAGKSKQTLIYRNQTKACYLFCPHSPFSSNSEYQTWSTYSWLGCRDSHFSGLLDNESRTQLEIRCSEQNSSNMKIKKWIPGWSQLQISIRFSICLRFLRDLIWLALTFKNNIENSIKASTLAKGAVSSSSNKKENPSVIQVLLWAYMAAGNT